MAFPTPVSDGEAVYVFDHFGTVARVALDGKLNWIVNGKQSAGPHNGVGASLRLCGDALFTYNGSMAIAWDKHTDRVLWRGGTTSPKQHSHGDYTSPVPMDVGATDVWLSPRGEVFRVKDGTLLLPAWAARLPMATTPSMMPATRFTSRLPLTTAGAISTAGA